MISECFKGSGNEEMGNNLAVHLPSNPPPLGLKSQGL